MQVVVDLQHLTQNHIHSEWNLGRQGKILECTALGPPHSRNSYYSTAVTEN